MLLEPKSAAFVFPGQGSQAVGMGKDLAEKYQQAKDIFSIADSILGFSISGLLWNGPEAELNETLNTQPALFIHSMAAHKVFQNIVTNLPPAMFAGHSLGELSAVCAAGALEFPDGLKLVRKRGELMKKAGEINPGGMAAILGLDIPTLDRVCREASNDLEIVQVANDNCPGQVVISGHKPALERAITGAKAAGAKRALPLAVSIAAHSPLMASIQDEWEDAVRSASFKDAQVPVIGNTTARPILKAGDLQAELVSLMQSRVCWTESVNYMVSQGVKYALEMGPGAVLGGLIKRITDAVQPFTFGKPDDLANLS